MQLLSVSAWAYESISEEQGEVCPLTMSGIVTKYCHMMGMTAQESDPNFYPREIQVHTCNDSDVKITCYSAEESTNGLQRAEGVGQSVLSLGGADDTAQVPDEKTQKGGTTKAGTGQEDKAGDVAGEGNGNEDSSNENGDGTDGSGAVAGDGGFCPYDVATLKAQYEAQCVDSSKKASFCCGTGGAACLAGVDDEKSGMATVAGIGTVLAQQLGTLTQLKGMAENCDSQNGLATFSAALSGGIAANCYSRKSTCENSCEQIKNQVQTALDTDACTKSASTSIKLQTLKADIAGQIASCGRLATNIAANATHAGTTMLNTAQAAKLCKDVIAASPPPVAPGIPGNDLCNDPSDLSNPYCRQQYCSQPGTASAPECQQASTNTNSLAKPGYPTNNYGGGNMKTASSAYADGIIPPTAQQGPGDQNFDPQKSGIAQTAAGGGGGPPGGGGGSGGAAGYDNPAAGGRGKLKTGIFQGFSSGSGYSVSSMGFQGGGGYSNPTNGSGNKNNKTNPFDLKKFLPKKVPQRKLAGLTGPSGTNGELAAKHDNIFIRVSNKYQQMCIQNRLWCGKK